jgi:GNAT superfamily N-acetyltransferase
MLIIKVREADPKDAVSISELMRELGYYINPDDIKDKILQLSNDTTDKIFVAELKSLICGVLSIHILPCLHDNANIGRITSLVVTKKYRRKGFGTKLMQEAEKFAWNQNCSRIEITSNDNRVNAHEFYTKSGYRSNDRRFIKHKP